MQVKVDGTVAGTATYGISRPDVCAVYPGRTGCPNVGYSYALNASGLSVGFSHHHRDSDRQRRNSRHRLIECHSECAGPAANCLH